MFANGSDRKLRTSERSEAKRECWSKFLSTRLSDNVTTRNQKTYPADATTPVPTTRTQADPVRTFSKSILDCVSSFHVKLHEPLRTLVQHGIAQLVPYWCNPVRSYPSLTQLLPIRNRRPQIDVTCPKLPIILDSPFTYQVQRDRTSKPCLITISPPSNQISSISPNLLQSSQFLLGLIYPVFIKFTTDAICLSQASASDALHLFLFLFLFLFLLYSTLLSLLTQTLLTSDEPSLLGACEVNKTRLGEQGKCKRPS